MSLVLYSWIMHPSPALIRGSIDIIFIHDKKKILPQSRMTFSSSYVLLFKYLDNYKRKYKNIRPSIKSLQRQIRVYMGNQPSIMQGTESG